MNEEQKPQEEVPEQIPTQEPNLTPEMPEVAEPAEAVALDAPEPEAVEGVSAEPTVESPAEPVGMATEPVPETTVEAEPETPVLQEPASLDPAVASEPAPVAAFAPQPPAATGNSKRKKIIIAAVVVLVVALLATVLALLFRQNGDDLTANDTPLQTAQTPQVARLGVAPTLIDGSAWYTSGKNDRHVLTTETTLREGDSVSTDAGARVILTFDDGSVFRLDESTSVTLASLVSDAIRIEQAGGTAYSRVVPSERSFSVVADGVVYTALGTAFATINTSSEKGVQVFESSVKVDGLSDAVAEGKQYFKTHAKTDLNGKVTTVNLDELKASKFMQWNLTQDERDAKFKDKLGVLGKIKVSEEKPKQAEKPKKPVERSAPAERSASQTGIVLRASNNAEGTVLSWSVAGVDTGKGFKIVRSSTSATPTFGKDESVYVDSAKARGFTWKGSDKVTEYWYRVCAYRGDGCESYSNAVKIQSVKTEHKKEKTYEKKKESGKPKES